MTSIDENYIDIFNSTDVLLESSKKKLNYDDGWKERIKIWFKEYEIHNVKSFLKRSHLLHEKVSHEELYQMSEIATTMFEKHCKDAARMKAFSEARIEYSIVNNITEQQSDGSCKDSVTSVKMKKVNGTLIPARSNVFQPQGLLGRIKKSKPKGLIGELLLAESPEVYGSDPEDEKQYKTVEDLAPVGWTYIQDLKGDFEKLFDSTEFLLMHTGDLYEDQCGIRGKKDLEEWVDDMLKVLDSRDMTNVDAFLWNCLSLVHTIPIFILQGMIRKGVQMSIRSHEDDARKGAFIEAGIEYEILKPPRYFHYPDVDGINFNKTSIIMKKKVEGNEKDGKDNNDNMETEEKDHEKLIFTFQNKTYEFDPLLLQID